MKYTRIVTLGLLAMLAWVSGCANPDRPGPVATVAGPQTPIASAVPQLAQDWTLINFGAPW